MVVNLKTRPKKQKSINLTDFEWTLLEKIAKKHNLSLSALFSGLISDWVFWQQFLQEYAPAQDLYEEYYKHVTDGKETDFDWFDKNSKTPQDLTLPQLQNFYPNIDRISPPWPVVGILDYIKSHSRRYIQDTASPEIKALTQAVSEVWSNNDLSTEEKQDRTTELYRKYEEQRRASKTDE